MRERRELADLLDRLGPAAPTLCEGWDTAHLAAHLVVRERRPDALVGFGAEAAGLGGPLAAWAHRLEDRLRESTPYAEVVGRLRAGPPAWSPMAWPPVGAGVQHDRVRHPPRGRAPRPAGLDGARAAPRGPGRALDRGRPVRPPVAGAAASCSAAPTSPGSEKRVGSGGRTVEGEPMELLLWASGRRDVARVKGSL